MSGYGRNNVFRKSATAAANKAVTLTLTKPEANMRVFLQTLIIGVGGKGTIASALCEIEDGQILPSESAEENKLIIPTLGTLGNQVVPLEYQGGAGKAIVVTLAAAGTEAVGYLSAIFYID